MFAALLKDGVMVTGADAPFMSTRTPRILNDPDAAFPLGNPGRSISILFDAVLSFGLVTVANTPVAPIIVIGSSVGTKWLVPALAVPPKIPPAQSNPVPGVSALFPATQFRGDEVTVALYVSDNVVVVSGDAARIAPVTRTPDPGWFGSWVIAAWLV